MFHNNALKNLIGFIPLMAGIHLFAAGDPFTIVQPSDKTEKLLVVQFENDFFYRTDRYFTNGISINYYNDRFNSNRLNRLLRTVSYGSQRSAFQIRQNMYTPRNLGSDSIEFKDRPYAGYLTATYRYESYNKRKRYYAELTGGILGQYSGTKITQEFVHQFAANSIPQGWHHQLSNAAIINIQYGLEYLGFRNRHIEITGGPHLRLGTLYTDVSIKSQLRFGNINRMFDVFGPEMHNEGGKNIQISFVLQPSVKLVVYDATLQGGVGSLNPGVYTVNEDQLERFIYSCSAGLNINFSGYDFHLATEIRSSSFDGGLPHKWGSISISKRF